MNEYKITYSVNGRSFTANRVERTEATARRAILKEFKASGSHADVEVTNIELLRDDACATKAQERETLEAIRKMVAELGPQSYVATAFEGCFEDAEQNIEYDFGCSQKRLADAAAEKVTELEAEIKKLRDQLAESEKNYEDARAVNDALDEKRASEIAALKAQVLSPDDLEDVRQLLEERVDQAEEQAQKAAAEIVRFAEAPALPEFGQAVKMNRECTATAKYYRDLLKRVQAIQTSYNAGA